MPDVATRSTDAVPERKPWLTRIAIIVLGCALWYFTQSLIGSRPPNDSDAVAGEVLSRGDALFRATAPINAWLHQNSQSADLLLVASSAVIDALGIWLIASSIFGPSIRPFIGLILVFALRQLMQATCVLPPPEGMIWRSPGVGSIFVTYQVANDFFFSGHTAIAVFGATQLASLRRPAFVVLGFAVAVFESVTVIVLRAHYTMDVFTGAVAALLAAVAAAQIGPKVDRAIAGLW